MWELFNQFEDIMMTENLVTLSWCTFRDHVPLKKYMVIYKVNAKLSDFNLNLQFYIVAITSDIVSVKIKFRRLSLAHQQICFNHDIHFLVMEVIFQKHQNNNEIDADCKRILMILAPKQQRQHIQYFFLCH